MPPSPVAPSPGPPHLGLKADAVLEGVLVVQRDPQVVPIVHKVVFGFAGHGDPRRTRSSGGGGSCRKELTRPQGGETGAGRGDAWRGLGARDRGRPGRAAARRPDPERCRGPSGSGLRGCGRRERRCGRAIPAGEEGSGRGGGGGSWRCGAPALGREQWARGPKRYWTRLRPRAVEPTARDKEEKATAAVTVAVAVSVAAELGACHGDAGSAASERLLLQGGPRPAPPARP
ncbi:hypothetical protein P7K49_037603 [Saguinus oedipus]|uniref:Uncharacterized protein n=1 Tax=Saguinus oedipus TaxID=9490 RepID=A0ABQ9TJ06_SAGOE|nr:hypothetical protein P7K49_037603 [Saguinus oedipus]